MYWDGTEISHNSVPIIHGYPKSGEDKVCHYARVSVAVLAADACHVTSLLCAMLGSVTLFWYQENLLSRHGSISVNFDLLEGYIWRQRCNGFEEFESNRI